MNQRGKLLFLSSLISLGLIVFVFSGSKVLKAQETASESYIRFQEPEFLTFSELQTLSQNPHPDSPLEEKLERFWTTPIISNEAYFAGAEPVRPHHPKLGTYLRLASWNIEKSIHMLRVIDFLTDKNKALEMFDPKKIETKNDGYPLPLYQRDRLMSADVLLLQEMDIGVKRSGYINAAAELAKALNMNYAYGPEQLEIDPAVLGIEPILLEDGGIDKEAEVYYHVDPERYKGVFGSAVLSRYPIKRVEVFQLVNQAYNWYENEKNKVSFLEKGRRAGVAVIFLNRLTREMKVGGRIYMRVDLEVPGLPNDTLTVINVHLEIKCEPEGREIQMKEILSYIQKIRNPVVLAGDFNSAPGDLSPTSSIRAIKRTLRNPTTWFSVAVNYLTQAGLFLNTTRFISNATKNLQNPLATNIPIIAPNDVKGLFAQIEAFRFADGRAFDFRGNSNRSINGDDDTLANSNQRDLKGFKTTFSVDRPITFIGKYRLDWIFVKSFINDPHDESAPYRLAPHFGETLEEMNTSLLNPLSDHHPNVVDLPFDEPSIE